MGSKPPDPQQTHRPRCPAVVSPRHRPLRLVAQRVAQSDQRRRLRTCRHGQENPQLRSRLAGALRRAGGRNPQELLQPGLSRPGQGREGTGTRRPSRLTPASLPARTRLRLLFRRSAAPHHPWQKGVFHRSPFLSPLAQGACRLRSQSRPLRTGVRGQDGFLPEPPQRQGARPGDQPSIGIILCAEKDDVEVEYALRSQANPIGVAAYQLQSKLPGELKGKLPTAKQLAEIVRVEMEREK